MGCLLYNRRMTQTPPTGDFILKWRGDALTVTLNLGEPRKGRAAFRTNIGHARVRRREIIAETERGETPLARAWTDIPLEEKSPGVFSAEIPLDEVGIFSGKACFFPEGGSVPEWPDGGNTHIKVESAETRKSNSIYTVFPRQFGSFREIVRRLDHIMGAMGFRIVQTLPPFPVPTTYAVMGEYGCPFAALDFLSVDPAMAEFDEYATPLDQFRELIDAVHSRRGLLMIDLPANHTGWASTLQTHHPEWFNRNKDGKFVSPGAWGVVWADLVELDYSNAALRSYMAGVFLFWCRNGVDGFRCDAGYMIPESTWEYIVARVREEYPDTIFMLEGLGGKLETTDNLLARANLDWAYSEMFQTYDRGAFEWYLPGAIARSEKFGTLVHFAETHDNDRLAKGGKTYARLRVGLSALLSWQGAWGMANGVEWYCTEKIDVHGKNGLNWGAKDNMIALISKLNSLLDTDPAFSGASRIKVVTRGEGNTLAVAREDPASGRKLLILANLDCEAEAGISWDEEAFPSGPAFDVLEQKKVVLGSPHRLKPGEIVCAASGPARLAKPGSGLSHERRSRNARFHWTFPRDVRRDVVVPENEWVEVSAAHHFRMRLIDPKTGMTLRVYRSVEKDGRHTAFFDAPHYKGDGSRCRELTFLMIVYTPGRSTRTMSRFLVPPKHSAARALLSVPAAYVRRDPLARTILSNGHGAASQMRAGWAGLASQYDSILAANPNPSCPADRIALWTRMRCWLQREGYTREFDSKCQTRFTADPAGRFAEWEFLVPCGMGRTTRFAFEVSLARNANAARLKVTRLDSGETDVGDQVRLVFRPDIEWRSFHSVTKAFSGPETLFPSSVSPSPRGYSFSPYGEKFVMSVDGGEYHHEPEWAYNVPHPEEAARGQDPSGDLFSPGWISADIKPGCTVEITGEAVGVGICRKPYEQLDFPDALPRRGSLGVREAMREALDLFIVQRDSLKTVIAGYPWFLDWGRDTFIFMRGMIAAGRIADSLAILEAFAAFEENGTLPNIIYGDKAGNRDTTDAQLWFIRCVMELEAKGAGVSKLKDVCSRIADNYIKGTPNGIRVDAASGLVFSPSHFTWMDTNYPACTPRAGYPVEIQALWISALRYLGREELADRAVKSVMRLFKVAGGGYFDCLNAPNGEPAEKASPEDAHRPNQLFLLTLGAIDDPSVLDATEELLIPGGIRTLDPGSLLYKGVYEGDENTSRKQAYHNGTAWAWPFPLYAEAMAASGRGSKDAALDLLAGAVENINSGCLCHISEIADGDSPHAQKGCTAQAWSASELLRVWTLLEEG